MQSDKTIDSEPRGDVYRQLIGVAREWCRSAVVIVRCERDLDDQGREALCALDASVDAVTRRRVTRWPGTILLEDDAEQIGFPLDDAGAAWLGQWADGLYEWVHPSRPEDPCLLREDGSPWLTTIAHERDSYLTVTHDELAVILDRVPGLIIAES